jgi:hypothetical protein
MGRISAATIAVITTIGLAVPAHADSDDDAFLNAMHSHNINNTGGDQALIQLGHTVCNLLGSGTSMNAVTDVGGCTPTTCRRIKLRS